MTATDTNAGKTYVCSLLIRALRARGIDAVGMKPICCGDRSDAESLWAAGPPHVSLNDINPVWLRTPAAPYTAAMIEERTIDLELIREAFERLQRQFRHVIVEGVGGWAVPILRDYRVSDLAAELGLPVLIVVANRLGALNHAILTAEAVRSRGLECEGLLLNTLPENTDAIATATNGPILEEVLRIPVLGELQPHGTRLPECVLVSRQEKDTSVRK